MEWKKEIQIHNFETDLNGNCSLPVIADLFQGAAEEQASTIGFGYDDMIASRSAWVLSRMLIKVHAFPVVGQNLQLLTWPKNLKKLFAVRDYCLDLDGTSLVSATSAWIVINMDTRRPVRPDSFFSNFTDFSERNAVDEFPGKIPVPEKAELTDKRRVRYTDLDVNRHMNNTNYIRWALDMFDESFFGSKKVDSVLINFTSELVYNDEVAVHAAKNPDDSWTVWGLKNGSAVFTCVINWK